MKRIAMITGATSGIGEATARIMATPEFKLIITGRRNERLQKLQQELQSKTEVYTLNFDVRDKEAVNQALDSLPAEWKEIDILINNAGNAHGLAAFDQADLDDFDAMIDINVKGLLYVSKKVVPVMVERKKGHIINIGSIAGKEVYPKGNVYCASKFAVDAISAGMRIDLNAYGIKVTEINPGLVETEFSMVRFKGDHSKADKVYEGIEPLTGKDVADVIYFAVTRPDHVNISELVIFAKAQASATIVHRNNQ